MPLLTHSGQMWRIQRPNPRSVFFHLGQCIIQPSPRQLPLCGRFRLGPLRVIVDHRGNDGYDISEALTEAVLLPFPTVNLTLFIWEVWAVKLTWCIFWDSPDRIHLTWCLVDDWWWFCVGSQALGLVITSAIIHSKLTIQKVLRETTPFLNEVKLLKKIGINWSP